MVAIIIEMITDDRNISNDSDTDGDDNMNKNVNNVCRDNPFIEFLMANVNESKNVKRRNDLESWIISLSPNTFQQQNMQTFGKRVCSKQIIE